MKQTAVEWLLNEIDMQYPEINLRRKEWMVDKAKEMEKEQMFKCKGNNDNGCFMESPGHDCGCFKRIQQEEPKQLTDLEIAMKLEEIEREDLKQETTGKKFYESADAVITVSKQLTELEVAIKLEEIDREEYQSVKDFSRGAKWQAKRMYSEEEVLQLLLRLQQTESYDNLYDWFEQYKKK